MHYIVGVDEVGRGPLAGPVTVCAVVFPSAFSFNKATKEVGIRLRDSKQLSEANRIKWVRYFKKDKTVIYAITSVSPNRIDRINIRNATNEAVEKTLRKLSKIKKLSGKHTFIYMDGGLEVSDICIKELSLKHRPKSIIRGDALIPAISVASILAKVSRDRFMTRMAKKYPHYGFERHKGYGTLAHYRAIRRHGVLIIHRRSFLKNIRIRYDK